MSVHYSLSQILHVEMVQIVSPCFFFFCNACRALCGRAKKYYFCNAEEKKNANTVSLGFLLVQEILAAFFPDLQDLFKKNVYTY